MAACNLRNLVEAMIDRIGADAVRYLLELREVFLDLADIDGDVEAERVLLPPKRRVGNAVEFLTRADRRLWHFDRHSEPGPGRNNHPRHGGEQPSRKAHTSAFHSPPPFNQLGSRDAYLQVSPFHPFSQCLPAYFGTELRQATLTLTGR